MNVGNIMHTGDRMPVVAAAGCFRDVLQIMDEKKLGAVCVVDEDKLVGLITDGDVRRLILKTQQPLPNLFLVDAEKLITRQPRTVSSETSLEDALAILEKYEVWVLPVVDNDGRLLGLLHMHSLLKAMIDA